jgi:TRAP-type C4-dicarboxylate transport system permease small subunit
MFELLKKTLRTLAATCLVSLLLIVILGILSKRFTLNITWTVELSEFLLAWLVMFGGAVAYLDHAHLGVDLVVSRLDEKSKSISKALSHLLIGVFSILVMVVGGGQLFIERWNSEQILPALGIKKAWFYLSVPLVGAVIAITACIYFFQTLRKPAEQ